MAADFVGRWTLLVTPGGVLVYVAADPIVLMEYYEVRLWEPVKRAPERMPAGPSHVRARELFHYRTRWHRQTLPQWAAG